MNPIERMGWMLREQVTRKHQCQSIEDLLDRVLNWLGERGVSPVDDEACRKTEEPLAKAG